MARRVYHEPAMSKFWVVVTMLSFGLTIGAIEVREHFYPSDQQVAEHISHLCHEFGSKTCVPEGQLRQYFAAGEWDCITEDQMLEADRPLRRAIMAADSLIEVDTAMTHFKNRRDEADGFHPHCAEGNRWGVSIAEVK